MSGAGNDFIVLDNRFYYFSDEELSALARRFCPRRVGIGADGLLALNTAEHPASHFRMRYVNADGSFGTMCGNGARCLARFARQAGIDVEDMVFESDAGRSLARVPQDPQAPVSIFFGPPRHFSPEVPLVGGGAAEVERVHGIWTGTEHVVCFTPSVAEMAVEVYGPMIRGDAALAPTGANVNFVEVLPDRGNGVSQLRVRTYEKGVEAETLACGTGAMASAIIARHLGHTAASRTEVHMPGGTLTVGFDLDGDAVTNLFLEGPAETVYRGSVEV